MPRSRPGMPPTTKTTDKNTGFPITNVGNDRRRRSHPLPALSPGRGRPHEMRRLRRPKRKTLDSRLDPRLRTSRTSVGNDRKKEADSFLRQAQDRRFARNDKWGVSLTIFVSMTGSEDVGLRYANPTYPDFPPSVIPDPDRGSSVFAFVAAPSRVKARDMPYSDSSKHPHWPHKMRPLQRLWIPAFAGIVKVQ